MGMRRWWVGGEGGVQAMAAVTSRFGPAFAGTIVSRHVHLHKRMDTTVWRSRAPNSRAMQYLGPAAA